VVQLPQPADLQLLAVGYLLVAILYRLVCGKRAFEHQDVLKTFHCMADGDYVRPGSVVQTLPDCVANAINGARRPDRDERDERRQDYETPPSIWSTETAPDHRASASEAVDG
jgi:hypothetical protein